MVYNNLSSYLRQTYGKRIKKLCIDGGFTCPNRDGRCGTGGCIFCGERGAGEHIAAAPIEAQVQRFFARRPKGDGFIAYFQNFTNTYAPVPVLQARYDAALCDPRIVALAVGTRPDCITEEIAALLASYQERYEVWVELGLQTASDETARVIHRGYETKVFTEAVEILHRHGLRTVVHIIAGLPGEGLPELQQTVAFLNRHRLWGIKLHSIYVMRGTALERLWQQGAYTPPTLEEYTDWAAWVLAHIPPEMVVHRLTGDCQRSLLAAPAWNPDKEAVLRRIVRTMEQNNWTQGCAFRGER